MGECRRDRSSSPEGCDKASCRIGILLDQALAFALNQGRLVGPLITSLPIVSRVADSHILNRHLLNRPRTVLAGRKCTNGSEHDDRPQTLDRMHFN
jgi:hypothetical protein